MRNQRQSAALAMVAIGAVAAALLVLAGPAMGQQVRIDPGPSAGPLAGCPTDLRHINQVSGWPVAWPIQWQAIADGHQPRDAGLKIWAAGPAALDGQIATLREGMTRGEAVPRPVAVRFLGQIDGLAAQIANGDAPFLTVSGDAAFQTRWRALLSGEMAQAIGRYRAFFANEYLPATTSDPQIAKGRGSQDCYRKALGTWVGYPIEIAEMEATGRRLLAQKGHDLARLTGTASPAEALASLRAEAEGRTATRDEIAKKSEAAIARARAAADRLVTHSNLPEVLVVPLPTNSEESYPAGFYRPVSDQEGPAALMINLSRPSERLLMAEAIAFHETIPGHHLALTYPGVRGGFNAAYAEGWAIYAEQLAYDQGLYSSDFDRKGMIAKHLWAASRLVVDPGLHVHGWSREQAIQFMLNNTALSRSEVELEVDRYIALPGQSPTYMLGYDRLIRMRDNAKRRLGRAFDLKGFHEVVLSKGMRSLAVVARDVAAWVASRR